MSRSMRTLMGQGVAVVLALAATVLAPALAHAGAGASATPTFPPNVTVGQGGAGSITLGNSNSPPENGLTNAVCKTGDTSPPCGNPEPGIVLVPSCGQVAVGVCQGAGADPGVFQISSPASGRVLTACAGMSFTTSVTNPTFGTVRFHPTSGSVTLPGAGAQCIIDFNFTVLKAPTIDSNPAPGLQTGQTTEHTQCVSSCVGSPLTALGRGSNATTVALAQPTIATSVAAATIALGQTTSDSATVSGRVNPTAFGTVSFALYGPGDVECGNPIFSPSPIALPAAGNTVSSPSFQPDEIGTYFWRAFYSGDANNAGVSASCGDANETVVVKAQPTIATTASQGITLGGGTLTDTATVSGRVSPVEGATIAFALYGPNDATCSGTPAFAPAPASYPAAGGPVASPPFTPTQAGTYRWRATYSGDDNNLAVTGACGDPNESAVVADVPPPPRGTPAMTTQASPAVALGGQVTDTATLTGRVNPVAGATVRFELFSPGDLACTGTPVFTASVPVSAAGTATSPAFTPADAGTYRWLASYSGDASNNPVSGACNAANESVSVTSTTEPQILSARFASVPVVGRSVDLVIRASDPDSEISGVQVSFGETRGLEGISACRVRSLGSAVQTREIRLPYVFRTPGRAPHHDRHAVGRLHGCAAARGDDDQRGRRAGGGDAQHPARAGRARRRKRSRGVPPRPRHAARTASCRRRPPTCHESPPPRCASSTSSAASAAARRSRHSPRLARAASAHSSDMFRRKYFEHEKVPGGPRLAQRLRRAGYRGGTFAENIGYGSTNSATLQVKAWMNSPGHRANILHPRLLFGGIGVNIGIPLTPQRPGSIYTMVFGGTLR